MVWPCYIVFGAIWCFEQHYVLLLNREMLYLEFICAFYFKYLFFFCYRNLLMLKNLINSLCVCVCACVDNNFQTMFYFGYVAICYKPYASISGPCAANIEKKILLSDNIVVCLSCQWAIIPKITVDLPWEIVQTEVFFLVSGNPGLMINKNPLHFSPVFVMKFPLF